MRVLGVDPGLTRCGVGVVEGQTGRSPQLVDVGVIRTSTKTDHAHRLLEIEQGLDAWVRRLNPDAIAVERVFARSDVSTIMGTAQASALPMIAAARREIPLALHTPSEVKAAVTGNGRAGKAQVAAMVKVLLPGVAIAGSDAADALAVAIADAHLARST